MLALLLPYCTSSTSTQSSQIFTGSDGFASRVASAALRNHSLLHYVYPKASELSDTRQ